MKIKEIKSDNQFIAFIIPRNYHDDGIQFITSPEFSLQLGLINKIKNSKVERHIHPSYERTIRQTMEFIILRKGKLSIDFYDNNKKYLESCNVLTGDSVLFASGGHSINFLEKSEIIELRVGPYNENYDKEFF